MSYTLIMKRLPLALATFAFAAPAFAEDSERPGEGSREPQPKAEPTLADARREAQIWTSFAFNRHLKASDISVEVRGDRAFLTGTVDDQIEKDLAGEIARKVEGVESIDNRLVVDADYKGKPRAADGERDFATSVEDATITASVKSKLMWNDRTDGLEIDVDTIAGRVTLTGTADDDEARRIATRIARDTDGVVGVDNKLTIDTNQVGTDDDADDRTAATRPADRDEDRTAEARADVSDAWITTKVKSTLLLSRWVDGLDIDVDTRDGVVTLKGEADSAAERDLAVELADSIRGVDRVDASALRIGDDTNVAGVDEDDAD